MFNSKPLTRAVIAGALLFATSTAFPPPPALAQNTTANEGGDLAIGGPGTQPGQFAELRDIAFDAKGNLYALDGTRINPKTKAREGNLRVQKFDQTGKLLQIFDLKDEATGQNLGDKNDPQRVAADSNGNVYVSQPLAGVVQQFGPEGKFVRAFDVPRAIALTTVQVGGQERIAVVPSRREIVGARWTWLDGDKIVILSPQGGIEKTIPLPQQFTEVLDVAADKAGNFYLKAEPNAIYKVSPDGKLLHTFGGNNTPKHPEDGSEVLHTVAVDSKGNVYTMTWGNPGKVTRFDADGQTVTQRGGQFKWADPWSVQSSYIPFAVDPADRLWAAATHHQDPNGPNYKVYRAVPVIVRTRADYFVNPVNAVSQTPVRRLGFRPELKADLLYNVSYEPQKPVSLGFSIAAANRNVSLATVNWRAFDALKNEVGKGTFSVPLENGKEATGRFSFVPPRYGAYFVLAEISSPEGSLGALGEHVGVTPRFPDMPVLAEGDRKGGWTDSASQVWTGLPALRLHPGLGGVTKPEERLKKLDELDKQIAAGEKAGAVNVIQIVDDVKKFSPDDVRAVMERFKGRIKYVEVCNEPNFTGSVDDYFKIHKQTYEVVKAIDPTVVVMGPSVVNIDLGWAKRLYELGFKDVSDAVAFHDYEGHESISPEHWKWKYGELRRIMAQYGDENKPIWQTERAISGVRGRNFQGLVQAIRLPLHIDLLETLGIPNEHDFHYYLNNGGYSDVPTYVWSNEGPMPAALATRTRQALTGAMGRKYAGQLDFGKDGNDLFMGVRYAGTGGETVSLRNLGTRATPLEFGVQGATSLSLTDTWGNETTVPVRGGRAQLNLTQLPLYVRLPPNATLTAPKMDFGRDLAPRAKFSYSSTAKGDFSLLNNGILETYHSGNPNGDANGAKIWTGDLPREGDKIIPQTLEIAFERPQLISRVVLRGVRPDNGFCALLDYDLQYDAGGTWKTIESVHNPMPSSEEAVTTDATHAIWMDDTNFYTHQFPTVTTSKLRLVVRDVSRGFVPDERSKAWSNIIAPKFMLREVELFAPASPVTLASSGVPTDAPAGLTTVADTAPTGAATGAQALTFEVQNSSKDAFRGEFRAFAPAGWTLSTTSQTLSVPGHSSQKVVLQLAPQGAAPAGQTFVDAEIRDAKKQLVATAFRAITVAAPLEIAPQPAPAAQNGAQMLRADLKNTTANPLSGIARVRLSGAREVAPVEVSFGPIAPGQTLRVDFQVPGVDAGSERFRANYEILANGISTRFEQDLARQNWMFVGPFPREFNTDFGPEKNVDFSKSFTDMMGTEKKWTAIAPNAEGLVNLADVVKPNTEVVAYAATVVHSPRAQKAIFSVGTDDGGRGWLNGKEVYSDDGSHGATPGQSKIPVELQAGRNVVLLKITQGNGGWGFFFDLLDPQSGKPLGDVVYSAR